MKIIKALPLAILIVAILVAFIVGGEVLFGITTGWLLVVCASLFLGLETAPTKLGLLRFVLGALYGMAAGMCFVLFKPAFLILVTVLLTCKLMGKLKIVMNDYALTFAGIYTIGGVANPSAAWQDLLMLGISCLILLILCVGAEKKGGVQASEK
jgi:hypothetical protein